MLKTSVLVLQVLWQKFCGRDFKGILLAMHASSTQVHPVIAYRNIMPQQQSMTVDAITKVAHCDAILD